MESLFRRIFLILILYCGTLINPNKILAEVSLPWSTTFDCAEWEHTGSSPKCDDLATASDRRTGTKITTAANHSSGAGGRGMRQYLGDGNNNQTSGLAISFKADNEIWVRWYMRYESGFTWSNSGGYPLYDKWLYIYGSAGNLVPEFDGDEVNVWSSSSGNHQSGSANWSTVNGGIRGDGQWHLYEVHIDATSTKGTVELWIDGKRHINVTNFSFSSTAGYGYIVIGSNCNSPDNGSPPGYVDFDDVAISNTGYIGPINGIIVPSAPSPPPPKDLHIEIGW
jgi:hypothetical protein